MPQTQPTERRVGFVLVHGTWSRRSAFGWPEKSPLVGRIQTEPWADQLDIVRFPWSGRNNHHARHRAGIDLSEFVANAARERRWDQVILVCHSHGGNVAHIASEHLEIRHHLLCFATPFLEVREKLPWVVGATILATLWLAPYAAILYASYRVRNIWLVDSVQIATGVLMAATVYNLFANLVGLRPFVRWNPVHSVQKWESKSVTQFRALFPSRTRFVSQLALYSRLDEALGIFRSSVLISLFVANSAALIGLWVFRDQFWPGLVYDLHFITRPELSQRELPYMWSHFAPVAMVGAAIIGLGILIYDLARIAVVAMALSITAAAIQWLLRCCTIGYEPPLASLLLEIRGHAVDRDPRTRSICVDTDEPGWRGLFKLIPQRLGFTHKRMLSQRETLDQAVDWCKTIVDRRRN